VFIRVHSWLKILVPRLSVSLRLAVRTILLLVLILLFIGLFPGWGYASKWGYYPFSGIGLLLLVVILLALTGIL